MRLFSNPNLFERIDESEISFSDEQESRELPVTVSEVLLTVTGCPLSGVFFELFQSANFNGRIKT